MLIASQRVKVPITPKIFLSRKKYLYYTEKVAGKLLHLVETLLFMNFQSLGFFLHDRVKRLGLVTSFQDIHVL